MPDYDLVISVRGRNLASNAFNQIENSLRRIGETAFGVLTARALEGITLGIGQAAASALNAASAYQLMQLNLASLTTRELVQMSGDTMDTALAFEMAEGKARLLMNQLARMAILSPYMLNEVSNTFRLNMAFGYTTDQAMKMTNGLLMMAAGIGADNEMLKRMAYNLAQVRQQGKVTALDVRQLALAGLDLEGVLKWVSKQMGFTIKDHNDFNKLIKQNKITWEDFATNFEKYADKYFRGATERMAKTMVGLKNTLLDVFNLTMPKMFLGALDEITVIGAKMLDMFTALYDSGVLDAIGAQITAWAHIKLGPLTTFATIIAAKLKVAADASEILKGNLADTNIKWASPEARQAYIDMMTEIANPDMLQIIRDAIGQAFGPEALQKFDRFYAGAMKVWDAFQLIRTAWDQFKIGDILGALKTLGVPQNIIDFVDSLMVSFGNLKTFWEEQGPPIMQGFSDLAFVVLGWSTSGANTALDNMGKSMENGTKWILDNGPVITKNILAFCQAIITNAPLVKQAIIDFIGDVGAYITGSAGATPLSEFIDKISTAFTNLKTFFDTNGADLLAAVGTVVNGLLMVVTGQGGNVGEQAKGALAGVGDALVNATQWLVDNGPALVANLQAFGDYLINNYEEIHTGLLALGAGLGILWAGALPFKDIKWGTLVDLGQTLLLLAGLASSGELAGLAAAFSGVLGPALLILAAAAVMVATPFIAIGSALFGWYFILPLVTEGLHNLEATFEGMLESNGLTNIVRLATDLATSLDLIRQAAWLLAQILWFSVIIGFQVLWGQITTALMPKLRELDSFLTDTFGPTWTNIKNTIGLLKDGIITFIDEGANKLDGALKGINDWLQGWIDKLQTLLDLLKNWKTPDDTKGGSPSPYEKSLRGINDALDGFIGRMDTINTNMGTGSGGEISRGDSRVYNIVINGGSNLTENDFIRLLQKAGVSSI